MYNEIFGDMRSLTEEEQEALDRALDEISQDAGIILFDFMKESD